MKGYALLATMAKSPAVKAKMRMRDGFGMSASSSRGARLAACGFLAGASLVGCSSTVEQRSSGAAKIGDSGAGGGATSPPAQGAVEITINASAAGVCNHASGQITAPPDPPGNPNAVDAALSCDLAKGCKPDQYVLIDGNQGSTVACSVAPSGDGFAVNVSIVSGTRMTFRASGTVSATGGTMQISEQGANTQGEGLFDSACIVQIAPDVGMVKKGAIWARFDCGNFAAQGSASGEQCGAVGAFIFENCGS